MHNQRLPFLDLQNKKMPFTENTKQVGVSSKHQQKSPIGDYHNQMGVVANRSNSGKDNQGMNMDCQSQGKMANIHIVKESVGGSRSDIMNSKSEEEMGEEEYKLCLKKALKESFEENDYLRKKIDDVMKENKLLKEDIEEKEGAILELAQFYEHCKLNHKEQNEAYGNNQGNNEDSQKQRKSSF